MASHNKNMDFYGLLIQGKLHDAVKYLQELDNKQIEIKRYYKVFKHRIFKNKTNNSLLNNVLNAYSNYYADYFWDGISELDARNSLQDKLLEILKIVAVDDFEQCEELIGKIVEQQGYYFLGGMTGILYGPYIWKNTEKVIHEVEIPCAVQKVTINMMDGFISRSWLDFISFGKIGTGGWSSRDGELFCVRSSYKNKMSTSAFQVSYLKHEAQHISDYQQYGKIDSIDLEYRAKLTELIYYPNLRLLNSFIKQSNDKDKNNTHSYASYLVVSNLSKKIFNEEYVNLWSRWNNKGKVVRKCSLKLLEEHNQFLDKYENSP